MDKKARIFPRTDIIDRQKERTRLVLRLEKETLREIRGGDARYGLPKTYTCPVEA